ncbi:aldose 1-epimerase family protein [Ligilactobacillus saerimneri]|uniref:aldose 1-epimerase family protein n=1 Tax=Ligilactobacillus saerimneri TaxID=228229 RepID=UPI0024B251F5|nr:aldose 1-epimerase family protein [Ligilactobacillus saerimneri]MDI9206895.1 aldose 1-epimerase family protein [Ligilactobacillus saerimneri]
MTVTIENDYLKVTIGLKGAQPQSIWNKGTETEYLWQGDERYWKWQAPQLFPIIGKLKNDTMFVDGKAFHMQQHGFGRHTQFMVVAQTPTQVTLALTDNATTRTMFPYKFRLEITYHLQRNKLQVQYRVENRDKQAIYFSLGGHPGFNVPLQKNQKFTDYQVELSGPYNEINLDPFSGLARPAQKVAGNQTQWTLTRQAFANDAHIYEFADRKASVALFDRKRTAGVRISSTNVRYWGVWSTYPAAGPFVCIEPWWGIDDTVTTDQDFTHKFANNMLAIGAKFAGDYTIAIY